MAIEISDVAAKKALQIYVQYTGKPHDGIRAAILAVVPDHAPPSLDGEYWTERFDILTNALDALAVKVERLTAPAYDRAFQRGLLVGQVEQEARELQRIDDAEEVDEEAIFERGREVGREEAVEEVEERAVMRGHRAGYDLGWKEGRDAVLAGLKTLQGEPVVGPSDYEIGRDALTLATRLWAGQTEAVLDDNQQRDFLDTVDWLDARLRILLRAVASEPDGSS